jgi:hypothetical protein
VDGSPAPILRANVALSAVAVRAGTKQVEFVFESWSVKIGIGITVAMMIAIVLTVGFGFFRR